MSTIKVNKSEFEFLSPDFPDNPTKAEIEDEIRRLETLSKYYYNKQWSEKTIINSSYGALASKYFVGFNLSVASSVTEMGRNIVKYGAEILDNYFLNYWHIDTELHQKLGLLGKPIKLTKSVLRYGDSVDSLSYLDIEYDEYELGKHKFTSFSKLFVNRNNELKVINPEGCMDNEDIIYVIDYLKIIQDVNL